MTEVSFFDRRASLTLQEIVALTGARSHGGVDLDRRIVGIASLDQATPADIVCFDNEKFSVAAATTRAGACLTTESLAADLPQHINVLGVTDPYRAFVEVARTLFPEALRPSSLFGASGIASGAFVHASVRMEQGVTIDPGAVIAPNAEIGAGTVISAGAVIGPRVRIGRACAIGANATIVHSLIGDRVIVRPGCAIGQDGFGFALRNRVYRRMPQVARVIIQDDVEIGAGTTINRGTDRDTVVGEGAKIDNLVQVGHNALVGRHCIVAAQTGISSGAILKDFVILGPRTAVNGQVTIGEGARLAAGSVVVDEVPAGAAWAGAPAKPVEAWSPEIMALFGAAPPGG